MRIQYRSLARPKGLAQRINTVFPALSHMQAQEWAARMLGYRDWHELAGATGEHVVETPDFVFSLVDGNFKDTAESRAFFKRSLEQRSVLEQLVGRSVPNIETLFFHVDPNYPDVRYRKLGSNGKGSACFKGLGWDVFGRDGEEPGVGGGICEDVGWQGEEAAHHIYHGLPQGQAIEAFAEKLVARMRRSKIPYPKFDDVARNCLLRGSFAKTEFWVEELDGLEEAEDRRLAIQKRCERFFVMKNGAPTGFAVLDVEVNVASDSQEMTLQIDVDEAWWPSTGSSDILYAMGASIASWLVEPLCRLIWFRVNNPNASIQVYVFSESESSCSWALVESIHELLEEQIRDRHGEEAMEGVTFDSSICP